MDLLKEKAKKSVIARTWNRCRSLGSKRCPNTPEKNPMTRSKSWHGTATDKRKSNKRQVAPDGCFSVLVGTEKRRFAVKTEYVNHPMFKLLLEDAESEYGYRSEGPIELPCDAELFYRVLAEMESGEDDDGAATVPAGCGFGCSPSRRRLSRAGGCGSYGVLSAPSRMIKMNQ